MFCMTKCDMEQFLECMCDTAHVCSVENDKCVV